MSEECAKCKAWMRTYGVPVFYCRADEDRTVAEIQRCFDEAQEGEDGPSR